MNESVGMELFNQGWVQGSYQFCKALPADLFQFCWAGSKTLFDDLEKQLTDKRNTLILLSQNCHGSPIETYDILAEKMEQILESIHAIEGLNRPYLEEETNEIFETVYPTMRRSEVSIALLDHFVRWNFDSISLSDSDNEGIDTDI